MGRKCEDRVAMEEEYRSDQWFSRCSQLDVAACKRRHVFFAGGAALQSLREAVSCTGGLPIA